jgi:amylosucrase
VPTTSAWATYLRCHDDIGWAIDDADAAAVGFSGHLHRAFLAEFYAGEYPGTFARGMHFQSNPLTGDRRTSGSAASLTGIEAALASGDAAALDTAVDRLLCAYAMVFGFGGIPLIYMGDELGLLNDHSCFDDADKRDDNRWIHRPAMDWALATAPDAHPVAGRILAGFRRLVRARTSLPSLHAAVTTETFTAGHPALLVMRRRHAARDLVEVYNLSEEVVELDQSMLWPLGGERLREAISGRLIALEDARFVPPYAAWWLTLP